MNNSLPPRQRSFSASITVAIITQLLAVLMGLASLDGGYFLKAVLIVVPFFWFVALLARFLTKGNARWIHWWLRYCFLPMLSLMPIILSSMIRSFHLIHQQT